MKNIGVIGAGVIGLSWAALFSAKGHTVYIYDVVENYEEKAIRDLGPMLEYFDKTYDDVKDLLHFETDLKSAVEHVDLIQENGPENLEFKKKLYAEIEDYVDENVIFVSSSSGIVSSLFAADLKHPERALVGHPFNPPHIVPLVEIVPSPKTSKKVVEDSIAFYESLGKVPVLIDKEATGFVGNRLQTAFFQEAAYIVEQGIATPEAVDKIVENSLGIRWATNGPFKSFHLGGGPTGIAGFFAHLGDSLNDGFKNQETVDFTKELQATIAKQVEDAYGVDIPALSTERDERQAKVIEVLETD